MTKFNNGKITSIAIFYDHGVPNYIRSFGFLTTINYQMLGQIVRNNIKNKRPMYSFI